MTIEAGVWIDEHKAVLFLAAEGGHGFQHFLAADSYDAAWQTDGPELPAGDRSRRIRHNRFYDEVIACLHEADGIVVLGPGEAKWELVGRMSVKKLKGDVVHVGSVEALTEFEIAALVREVLDNCWRPESATPEPKTRDPVAHRPQTRHRKS
jgi:hypothetical protein